MCGDVALQFREDLHILHEISSGVRKGFAELLVAEKPRDKVSTSALKIKQKDVQQRSKDKLQILLEVSELLSNPEEIDALLQKIVEFLFVIMPQAGGQTQATQKAPPPGMKHEEFVNKQKEISEAISKNDIGKMRGITNDAKFLDCASPEQKAAMQ